MSRKKLNKNLIAIIAIKKNSKRFPKKNLKIINKEPLFWHSVKPFLSILKPNDIYITTNSHDIKNFCLKKKLNIIWRGPNKSSDEEQLFDVIKFAYSTLNFTSNYVVSVLANSPFHSEKNLKDLKKQILTAKFDEVRSFDQDGNETGLFGFKSKIFLERYEISNHLGCIKGDAKEIHYKKEFQEIKKKYQKNEKKK